jgi:LAO/AO transport system kinase
MTLQLTTDEYIEGIRSRDRAVLGRAITLVESNRPDHRSRAQELLTALLPETGGARRVGVSGVPGVGKSTFIERFGCGLIDAGHRVAVLAVDPSSSVTRGSILGDKTRMERLAGRDEAFIRPSPTSGSLGGVTRKTRETILVCEAAGFDVVIVETVGVGQAETVVADMVDFFLLLTLTGGGDELQGIKRGILELADLVAVNKADGDNLAAAQRDRAELEHALEILRPATLNTVWSPPVVTASGATGAGLDRIWELIEEHHQLMRDAGAFDARRRRQLLRWTWSMVDEGLLAAVREHPEIAGALPGLERNVLEGRMTPTSAAETILRAFGIDDREG